MRIFKTTYIDRHGQTKEVKRWYISLRDHRQIIRKFPGFTDKGQTGLLGMQIERLVNYKVAGEQPDPKMSRWLDGIPDKLKGRFVKIGLLDARRAASSKLLAEHLEDFKQFLLAKDNTKKYVSNIYYRIKQVLNECRFVFWNDIQASKVQYMISGLRKYVKTKTGPKDLGEISTQTNNYYLQAVKQFCNWMVQDGRAGGSPVEHLKSKTVIAKKHARRSLTPDEIRRLLENTKRSPAIVGIPGPERALLYQLAVESGLRANELRSLKRLSFDFTAQTVTVESGSTKNREIAILPLRKETSIELQVFLADKLPMAKAFRVPNKTARMIKADLISAGIDYIDRAGRYADFHSLRHSTGSLLAAAGVHPKVIQSIMRHSDINLTMSRYTHIFSGQESEAIASLPDLSLPSKEGQKTVRTGTDNSDLAQNLSSNCGLHKTNMDNMKRATPANDSETAFLTTPGKTQACEQRVRYLQTKQPKPQPTKPFTETDPDDLALNLSHIIQKYPELREIIEAWPNLSDELKDSIKGLIQMYFED